MEEAQPSGRIAPVSDDALTAFLLAHPQSTPFHSALWGRAVERATGHRWHCLGYEEGGALRGVLPLHHVRSPLFGHSLVSSGFAVGGGILATDAHAATSLANAAVALAGELGVAAIESRGGPVPSGWTTEDDQKVGFKRPLAADRDAELLAIPRKHRAEVRKSLEQDLTVEIGRGPELRSAHYRCYAASVRNLGTPVFPRRLFDAVLDAFGDDADILLIRHRGVPVAAVLSLYWGGAVMPYWGGGVQAARSSRANERMYFELMDHARQRGMTHFDFGRSSAGSGPAAYKKNWGFAGEPLIYARWSANGEPARRADQSSGKMALASQWWKRLPLPVANAVGPIIARQLA